MLTAASPLLVASWLTIPANRFASMISPDAKATMAESTYTDEGMPKLSSTLFRLAPTKRYKVLTRVVHNLDKELHPEADFSQADDPHVAWLRDGKRIGLRTTFLTWRTMAARAADLFPPGLTKTGQWLVRFTGVPPPSLQLVDELYLAICSPEGIHVVLHDGAFGLTTSGRMTPSRGRQIQIFSGVGVRGWRAALELYIFPKMQAAGLRRLGDVDFDDADVIAAVADELGQGGSSSDGVGSGGGSRSCGDGNDGDVPPSDIYAGVPLGERATNSRSRVLTAIIRSIDRELLHPDSDFEAASTVHLDVGGHESSTSDATSPRSPRSTSSPRSAWKRDSSWRRDGLNVHCRANGLTWDHRNGRWLFAAYNIRVGSARVTVHDSLDHIHGEGKNVELESGTRTDELLLGLYTPSGLYVYRHDLALGMASSGKLMNAVKGGQIRLYGPKGERDWRRALEESILRKLDESRCERLAFVDWSQC